MVKEYWVDNSVNEPESVIESVPEEPENDIDPMREEPEVDEESEGSGEAEQPLPPVPPSNNLVEDSEYEITLKGSFLIYLATVPCCLSVNCKL